MSHRVIKVCISGATGWTGSMVTKAVLNSSKFQLVGALAQKNIGKDIGRVLGLDNCGILISDSLDNIGPCDVLVDYTKPHVVKATAIAALNRKIKVVIGTSGLTDKDYGDIDKLAKDLFISEFAAGNFSITAAIAKKLSLIAASHLPSWEIIDYASAGKIDSPSGTVRELAEELSTIKSPILSIPIEDTVGNAASRGGSINGTQVHSVRLPGYTLGFQTVFGLPHERLTIHHDAGTGAEPYVNGTLLACDYVMSARPGLQRGMDALLFGNKYISEKLDR